MDVVILEKEIIQYLESRNNTYIKISTTNDIIKIHNLIFKEIIDDNDNSDTANLYYGFYYKIQENYELMVKYYLLAIEQGNSAAMNNLARYYEQRRSYELMLKYYLLAIEHGYPAAMNNLGYYYYVKGDFDLMLKYYLLAIKHGHSRSMNNLGCYYYTQKDYDSMLKYYFLAIKHGQIGSALNIISYCQEHNAIDVFVQLYNEFSHIIWVTSEDRTQLIQIISKFLAKDLISADLIKIIVDINTDDCYNVGSLFKLVKQLLIEKIDLIDLHFNYSPNMAGCIEAKNDFINRLL